MGLQALKNRARFLSGLYSDLLETGIRYFFPGSTLQRVTEGAEEMPGLLGAVPTLATDRAQPLATLPPEAYATPGSWMEYDIGHQVRELS